MKAFNIELAKKNHPVQTRDGRPVRIICYDRKSDHNLYPIVALVPIEEGREETIYYTKKGVYSENSETSLDLFMTPIKKEGWVNVYKGEYGNFVAGGVFLNSFEAEDNIIGDYIYVSTTEINWEE